MGNHRSWESVARSGAAWSCWDVSPPLGCLIRLRAVWVGFWAELGFQQEEEVWGTLQDLWGQKDANELLDRTRLSCVNGAIWLGRALVPVALMDYMEEKFSLKGPAMKSSDYYMEQVMESLDGAQFFTKPAQKCAQAFEPRCSPACAQQDGESCARGLHSSRCTCLCSFFRFLHPHYKLFMFVVVFVPFK